MANELKVCRIMEEKKMKVRKDLKMGEKYGDCYFVKGMEKYLGEVVEVELDDDGLYVIKGDDKKFGWDKTMFASSKKKKRKNSE